MAAKEIISPIKGAVAHSQAEVAEAAQSSSPLADIEVVKIKLVARATQLKRDMRGAFTPASWLGKIASVFYPVVKLFAHSMKPDSTQPNLYMRSVRAIMNVCAPYTVPKPSGVISQPFEYKPLAGGAIPYVLPEEQDLTILPPVKGEWVYPKYYNHERANKDRKIVLYFPGGGYHIGGPKTHGAVTGGVAEGAHCPVCVVDYRKLPEHPYPATINDAITVYKNLLAEGFLPENIIVSGDSAGGHLALTLADWIQQKSALACNSVVLISPAVDFDFSDAKYATAPSDPMLPKPEVMEKVGKNLSRHVSSSSVLPHLKRESSVNDRIQAALEHPAISPIYIPFQQRKYFPPVFVSDCKNEILGVGTEILLKKLEAASIPNGHHQAEGFHAMDVFAGWLPEAREKLNHSVRVIATMLDTDKDQQADYERWVQLEAEEEAAGELELYHLPIF